MERFLVLTHFTAQARIPLLLLRITRSFNTNVHDIGKGGQYPAALTYGNIATILPTVFKSPQSTSNITSDRAVIIDFLTFVLLALLVVVLLTIWFLPFSVPSTYTLCCA